MTYLSRIYLKENHPKEFPFNLDIPEQTVHPIPV